jgi:hypothetical protein
MHCCVTKQLQDPGSLPVMLVGTVACHVASGQCVNVTQRYDNKNVSSLIE